MTQDQIEKLFLPWDQVEDWVEYQTIDKDGTLTLFSGRPEEDNSVVYSEWIPMDAVTYHCRLKNGGKTKPESLGLDWKECIIKRERKVEENHIPKVYVAVVGGNVVDVKGTIDCEVVVVDWDNIEKGDNVVVNRVCAESEPFILREMGIPSPG